MHTAEPTNCTFAQPTNCTLVNLLTALLPLQTYQPHICEPTNCTVCWIAIRLPYTNLLTPPSPFERTSPAAAAANLLTAPAGHCSCRRLPVLLPNLLTAPTSRLEAGNCSFLGENPGKAAAYFFAYPPTPLLLGRS